MHFHGIIQYALKKNETATISTLFYGHLRVWPIVMIVQTYDCVYILYLLNGSMKSLDSFVVGKVM